MKVLTREFKAGLSRHLARARVGEELVVTLHGKPVACMVGIVASADAGIARLLAGSRQIGAAASPP